MGLIIGLDDFTGKYKIAKDCYSEDKLELYIAEYEVKYLTELLGADLYALFVADLTAGVPVTQIYLDIFNAFAIDQDNCLFISDGMVKMAVGFVYFEYMRDAKFQNTSNGSIVNISELSREADFNETGIYNRMNKAVENYQVIQWYILDNDTVYPDFNGVSKLHEYGY